MAFCRNCGKEIDDRAVICPGCGVPQSTMSSMTQPHTEVDNGGFGWGALGFFVPVAGLILYLIWKDTKPKTSRAAGIGALVSVIVWAVFVVIYILIIVFIFSAVARTGGSFY